MRENRKLKESCSGAAAVEGETIELDDEFEIEELAIKWMEMEVTLGRERMEN